MGFAELETVAKERCKCGNRVPLGELKEGLCRACVREAGERRQVAQDKQRLRELKEHYLSRHPFYVYMPEDT